MDLQIHGTAFAIPCQMQMLKHVFQGKERVSTFNMVEVGAGWPGVMLCLGCNIAIAGCFCNNAKLIVLNMNMWVCMLFL